MAEDNKNIKIIVDRSEELKLAQATIDQLNQKIGSQQELLRKYLADDAERERIKAERVNQPAPPPIGGDTATLFHEEEAKQRFKFPYDQSSEVLDILSFASQEEAIKFLKDCASNPQSGDFKLANNLMGKAVKRVLKEGGSWEFQGNMCRYERRGDKVVRAERKPVFRRVGDD